MAKLPILLTNEVEITPVIDDKLSVYFNRGLISTQRVARALGLGDMKDSLIAEGLGPRRQEQAPREPLGRHDRGHPGVSCAPTARARSTRRSTNSRTRSSIDWLAGLGERLHIVLGDSKEDEEVLGEDGKPEKVTNPKTGKTKIKTARSMATSKRAKP